MHLRTKIGALGAAAALALAGCGSGDNNDSNDSNTNTDDPTLRLASSADVLGEESFKIEMTMGEVMNANGAIDPAAGTSEMTMTFGEAAMGLEMQVIADETDMWMNLGELGAMLGADGGWMHLDLSRLGPEGLMGVEPGGGDPANAIEMLQAVGDVTQVDDNTFEGVVDLTETAPGGFDDEMLAAMGDDLSTLEFTATVDDQDRLSNMVITLPDMPEMPGINTLEIRYYDYGAPVEITEPPADQVSPMPEMFYEMFEEM